jgi:arabinogalactan oligomer/maltooligosaccharide transport system substrate-binding protein
MTMKKALVLLTVLVLLAASLGISASVPFHTPAQITATIKIWHNWSPANSIVIIQILDDYATDHPSVSFDLYQPADMWLELDAAIPAGTGPDIVAWGNDLIGHEVSLNQIIDLNQLGVTDTWLSATYEPASVQSVKYMGKIWALPATQEGIALVYNKDLVDSSYLPADPLDFIDLRNKAQAFQTATGKPLICNQGFPGGDAYHIAPVFFGFGVPSYVDEFGRVYVNSLKAITAGTWLSLMPPLSPPAQDFPICQNALLNSEVGMWWTGPWAISFLSGLNYGIIPMGKPFVGIQDMIITINAQSRGNTSTALDVMQYLTNTENSITIALANLTIPANTAALHDPDVQALPTVAGFGSAMEIGIPMSASPYSACQWGPMGDAEAEIWSGTTPADALNEAQEQIESCIDSQLTHMFLPAVSK